MNDRKSINNKYKSVMHSARADMNPLSKLWSIILHFPPIEWTFNLLNKTILRPVPLITSGAVSLIGGLGLYSIALYNGYPMYGSEIPLLLLGGLFIGIIFDYLRIIFGGSS